MTIREIAKTINKKSKQYRMGEFQDLRKDIKGLSKKVRNDIFTSETISDEGWAFHFGGRREIQFNIGFEDEGLRYGLAFSLATSRTLPDLSILHPKIFKLNSLIRNEPDLFFDYKMWYWRENRSEISGVREVNDELIQNGTFIFLGKLMDVENIDYDEILRVFDDLLYIYQEIESDAVSQTMTAVKSTAFKFDNKLKKLPGRSSYNSIEREINVDVRHSILQEKLYNHLILSFGEDNVGLENKINGNRIDIVVRLNEDHYIFYEIKTGSSAKSCVRQGLGQLLEYAYFNNFDFKADMIIAGEFDMDKTTSEYINTLKNKLNIPISYYCIKL